MGEDPPRGRVRLGPDITVSRDRSVARWPVAASRVRALAAFVLDRECASHALLQFTFVGRRRMARIHRLLTGVAGPTDIVTLQHARQVPGAPVVGEVWIAPEVARDNARHFGTTLRDECCRLVVHGVLHTLGWDHPTDATREQSAMWRRQEQLLRAAARRGVT